VTPEAELLTPSRERRSVTMSTSNTKHSVVAALLPALHCSVCFHLLHADENTRRSEFAFALARATGLGSLRADVPQNEVLSAWSASNRISTSNSIES